MLTTLALMAALQPANTLSAKEVKQGWKLLFDGKTTKGWHNFKATGVEPGWQVENGELKIVDASKAGDICSDGQYDWFELKVDFKIGKGQNSGVMYHVIDSGDATWHSGPEIQIYDYHGTEHQQITGWLYELYEGKKDMSKPSGEWNSFDIIVSPKKCMTSVNGVKYYEYNLNSKDFWARVAKSKFAEFPEFAKSKTGSIAIQGDHGNVAFRNIKIRKLKG